jgi:hypothetical protein
MLGSTANWPSSRRKRSPPSRRAYTNIWGIENEALRRRQPGHAADGHRSPHWPQRDPGHMGNGGCRATARLALADWRGNGSALSPTPSQLWHTDRQFQLYRRQRRSEGVVRDQHGQGPGTTTEDIHDDFDPRGGAAHWDRTDCRYFGGSHCSGGAAGFRLRRCRRSLAQSTDGLWSASPVVRTSGNTGPWDQPGSARTVHLADGSTAREQVTAYERPVYFAYRTSDYTFALRYLANSAEGQWWFKKDGSGTQVRWTYTFRAKNWLASITLALFVRTQWVGYMRTCIRNVQHQFGSRQP